MVGPPGWQDRGPRVQLVPSMAVSCFACFPHRISDKDGPGPKHCYFILYALPHRSSNKKTWLKTWPFHLCAFPHRISNIPDLVPNMAVLYFMCFPIKIQTERTWFQTWPFHALRDSHLNFSPNGPGSKHGCFIVMRFPTEQRTWFQTWPFHFYAFLVRISIKMDLVPNMAVPF